MLSRLRRLIVLLALLVVLPITPARAATPELPERIAAGWRTDRIYLDPRLAPAFPAAELTRIRTAASTAAFGVYVALVPQSPYTREHLVDLPTLLQARIGQPGLYVVRVVSDDYWSGEEELFRAGGLKGRSLVSVQLDDEQRYDVVDDHPAPGIVRTIQEAATAYDGRPLPPVPAGDLEPEREDRGLSVTDREDRSAYIGIGVGAVAGFALTLWLSLRRKRRKQDPRGPFGKPSVSVAQLRTKADQYIRRADRAIERPGLRTKLSVRQLDQRDDATRRLDAARALRNRRPDDLLALAGAFVLARQAEQVAGGSPVQPPCFFDPTHQPGTRTVTWQDGVEVPACTHCAQALAKGRRPLGLRVWRKAGRFGRDREIVSYWDLDPEDSRMVATGFGALSDDLPELVTERQDEPR